MRTTRLSISYLTFACAALLVLPAARAADGVLAPIDQRFAEASVEETPDFQKHVVPLFGRLGCNGRACHGSFQGQGGFRLSLFGYDFRADHAALFDEESPRVDVENVDQSLILAKPTDADEHEGGQRYELGSWEHHVLQRWVAGGGKFEQEEPQQLRELQVTPAEIWFADDKSSHVELQVVAVWADGSREDVTPLCRFHSNDDVIAKVDADGRVDGGGQGDTHVVVSYDNAVVPIPVIRPATELVGDKYPDVSTPTRIDELAVAKLRKLGIVPSELSSDAEFLRRVRLDITGTLPTPAEVEAFLASDDPDKRAKKIDELLETPAYAAWWTTRLCDFTGNNEQNLNNVSPMRNSAPRDWYDWIYKRVAENTPYDQLVEGIVTANSMQPGQSYLEFCREMSDVYRDEGKSYADLPDMTYYWSRRDFQNDVEARAIGFAYSFMGIRIQCAQCHKHPFDQWSKDDFHQFKNFFSRIVAGRANAVPREYRDEYNELVDELGLQGKRGNELRRMLPDMLKQGKTIPFPVTSVSRRLQRTRQPDGEYPEFDTAKFLGGEVLDAEGVDDPRVELMEWLRLPENRFFAPAFVNRVWAAYFNVGIVEPPDDMSLANPPSNKPLLDYLARGFIESGFDMKWLHREIANSRTYQLTWQPNETNRLDERNFSRAVPRRLPAEVTYDALQQATSSDERVAEMHENVRGRAIALPGAGIRRNNGDQGFVLSVFGRSTRESNCDCDRSQEPTLLQTVYLQNDASLLRLLDVRRGSWLEQVDGQLRPHRRGPQTPQAERQARGLENQIANLERRLKKLRQGGNPQSVVQAERRLEQLDRQLRQLQGDNRQAAETDEVSPQDIQQLITQAYLRTLSRYPSENELARSQEHVSEADNPVDGVRDVLWALLNTKEFIVNH